MQPAHRKERTTMGETPESLLKLVNAAGFLFQLRVEQEIKQTHREHRWSVLSCEHRWTDPDSHEEGFIDLVLENDEFRSYMVIECKRVGPGTTWVFLVPDASAAAMQRARLLWTYTHSDRSAADWAEFRVVASPESAFCTLRGQNEKSRPMLERLAGILLRSTECLANADLQLHRSPSSRSTRIYVPVIITTADLQICRFDPVSVDLLDGRLPPETAEFESVPFLRFRKSLSSTMQPRTQPSDLTQASAESERTVFVVSAAGIADWLAKCKVAKFDWHTLWPWEESPWQF
jgi:hypothetical protein